MIEVTVAGTRIAKSAGSAHILRPEQLERYEYDDPHAALMQVPGVYVRQEDGFGLRPNISLRGANSDRSKKVTLMEDEVLFGPAPYSAPAAYYFPLTTRMRQLRVIKGPSTVAYGPQTIGGAIDFVTRDIPSAVDGGVDLALGQYGYGKAHAYFGSSDGQTGFLVEGVRLNSDGFKELPNGGDTGFTRNEWMVKGSYILDPTASVTHEFRLRLGYSDEVSNETYLGLTDEDFESDPDRRYAASALDQMKNHRTQVWLTHLLDIPAHKLKVQTTAYRHDLHRAWRKLNRMSGALLPDVLADPTAPTNAELYAVLVGEADSSTGTDTLLIGPNDRTFVSQGIQSRLDASFHTGPLGHRLEAGLRLHHDSIRRRHSQDAFVMQGGRLLPVADVATEVTTANEASTTAVALHVLDAITFADLTLTPGLRVEIIHAALEDELADDRAEVDDVVWLPGVGAFYELLDGFGVLAGVYRGFSPAVLSLGGEEQQSRPEYSMNYEGGVRFSRRHSRAELIGFFNQYSNLTNVCTFSNGCFDGALDQQFDAGEVHIYGFEAYAEHRLRLGPVRVPLSAAYTFTRTRFDSSFVSQDPIFGTVAEGDELPYVPRHQFNATLAAEHRWAGINLSATYVSVAREQAGGGSLASVVATDGLFTVDAGATVNVISNVEFYANLRNVFDRRGIVSRRPFGARPNPPRMLQVGLKAQL